MNTTHTNDGGSVGSLSVFLFGAMYNLLLTLINYTLTAKIIESVILGSIMVAFKLLGDWITKGGITRVLNKAKNRKDHERR